MSIDYVEIRSAATRELLTIIDDAKSIIWHPKYYSVGDFEVYTPVSDRAVRYLVDGNFVTRPGSKYVGIIEKVNVTYNATDGRMIIASGRFAKSMLDRRLIYKRSGYSVSATVMRGNVEAAVRALVKDNAISCPFDSGRNMEELALGELAGLTDVIRDESGDSAEKQATYKGLLAYTDAFLQEYGAGAYCALNADGKLAYTVFRGVDRTFGNTEGNQPVIFSQDYDNLVSTEYLFDTMTYKNAALIGGEGEGTARFCSILKYSNITGSARRETFVDGGSTSKTYKDENDEEQTLTDAQYDAQLKSLGRQTTAGLALIESLTGEIDLTNGSFRLGRDFDLGDIVTVQDVEIGRFINTRILEITEVQDDNGYMVTGVYGT